MAVRTHPKGTSLVLAAPRRYRRSLRVKRRGVLRKALLVCGVLYPISYIVANDLIAAKFYDGYSRIGQAISELSATEAPSKTFLTGMLPVFSLLVVGFGLGVWQAAHGSRALRVTGGLLVAQGLLFPLWLLFPMTSREEMVEGTRAANDVGHLVLSGTAVLFIMAELGFSAPAFGKRFRLFSVAMGASALTFGALMNRLSSGITEDHTPWMGFAERITYGSWLLWMAVLAIALGGRELKLVSKPHRAIL
jgi:hypothetical protein